MTRNGLFQCSANLDKAIVSPESPDPLQFGPLLSNPELLFISFFPLLLLDCMSGLPTIRNDSALDLVALSLSLFFLLIISISGFSAIRMLLWRGRNQPRGALLIIEGTKNRYVSTRRTEAIRMMPVLRLALSERTSSVIVIGSHDFKRRPRVFMSE